VERLAIENSLLRNRKEVDNEKVGPVNTDAATYVPI